MKPWDEIQCSAGEIAGSGYPEEKDLPSAQLLGFRVKLIRDQRIIIL
jgi:hypothetical protein